MLQVTSVPSPDYGLGFLGILALFIIVIVAILLANWIYSRKLPEGDESQKSLARRARIGIVIVLLAALTGPFSLNIYLAVFGDHYNFYVMGLWWMSLDFTFRDLIFDMTFLFTSVPFSIPRFGFIYMLQRYYNGLTTMKRVGISGIISEMPMVAMTIFVVLIQVLNPLMVMSQMFFIPIPIPVIIGAILIMTIPVPKDKQDWLSSDEPGEKWWEKPEESKEGSDSTSEIFEN